MARRSRQTEGRNKGSHWTVDEARRMLAAWERSGLTVAAFCRKRGIRPKRLYWWRRRLAEWAKDEPEPVGQPAHDLVEAEVIRTSPAPTSAAVKVHLRSGDRIEVMSPTHVEADWLLRLVAGLSGESMR